MSLVHMNFQSSCLGNNTDINVILPDKPWMSSPKEFYQSGKKYPVLFLLHGTFGDYSDWLRKSNIELYATERDLIVVMASALNSNYMNWPKFGLGFRMWDFLTDELMPLIYGWFPASDKREDNYIAGLSMGGRGTAYFAFSKPEYFAGAAILSAAPTKYDDEALEGKGMMGNRTAICVENAGGKEAFLASPENVWDILPKAVKDGNLPKLYFSWGSDDKGIAANMQKFIPYAKENGLEAEFVEVPGFKHEWRFWDLAIEKALDFFGIHAEGAGNPF